MQRHFPTRLFRCTVSGVLATLTILGATLNAAPMGSAQTTTPADPQDFAIWKIRSPKNPQNTVYLLGTIHASNTCEINSPTVDKLLQESEVAVFEVDFKELLDPTASGNQLSLAFPESGDRPLKERIDAATYLKINEKMIQQFSAGSSPNQSTPGSGNDAAQEVIFLDILSQLMTPEMIYILMTYNVATQAKLSPECGMDLLLSKQAQDAGKTMAALETGNFQMELLSNLFDDVPDAEVQAAFEHSVKEDAIAEMEFLFNAVKTGDIKGIETSIAESCQSTPTICNKMLTERNHDWLKQIQVFLTKDEDYFVMVGAGHLVGDEGLIELLKKNQYKVKRVS